MILSVSIDMVDASFAIFPLLKLDANPVTPCSVIRLSHSAS